MSSSSNGGKRRAQATEVIDVDEYAKKFEPSSTDIITLDAKDFRKSVREGKKRVERPSVIGNAIAQARALHGPPAAKRQKTEPMAPSSLRTHRTLPDLRETRSPSASSSSGRAQAVNLKRPVTTLELSDSDDEEIEALLRGPPPKKPRANLSRLPQVIHRPQVVQVPEIIELFSDEGSDEEESDWDPPGWDVNDEDRWTPMRVNLERIENLATSLSELTINHCSPPINLTQPIDITTRFRPKPIHQIRRRAPQYSWEMLPAVFRPRTRSHFMELPTQPIIRTWKEVHQPLLTCRRTANFKQSPGAIHNVQQKGHWTIVTSGCVGGEPDTEDEDRSPYNQSGSLITYDTWTGRPEIPVGHVGTYKRKSDPDDTWLKHYALHDAQFDPLSDVFVSSGADRKVLFWQEAQEEDIDAEPDSESEVFGTNPNSCWRKKYSFTFSYPPNQLAFKPVGPNDEASILAVAERRIRIFSLTDTDKPERELDFRLFTKKNEPHVVGNMVWGRGPTASCLFASSEPDPLMSRDDIPQALFIGKHKVFDIENQTTVHELQAEEAGDSLCINSSGTTIALTTTEAENRSILRLFDVGNKDKRPTSTITVDPYPSSKARGFEKYEGEVTSTAFSPDEVFLALGRNDNTVHVYDTRYLHKGPLYRLEHEGECKSAGKEKYGIAKVEWLHSEQTRRIALATAGEDGCVRLWNPLKAMDEDNGQIIAEVDSDIGYFSIGDPHRGENRLVVGDLSGQVSFFDSNF